MNLLSLQMVLATLSKHDLGGAVAIALGVIVLGVGLVKAAIRSAMLLVGAVVVILGVLLVTRTI